MASGTEKAFKLLKNLPRVSLSNLKPLRKKKKRDGPPRTHLGGKHEKRNLVPLGVEGHTTSPFYLRIPREPYYKDFLSRRQLPLISLLSIQRSIDIGCIDSSKPIDLTTFSNTPHKKIDPKNREYGFNLTDEGADQFDAKINVEVQHASEQAIAAIERNGGTVVTKYYDIRCVEAMVDAKAFFLKGIPIPVNKVPPQDALRYYINPKNRGYLANPAEIAECRYELAQQYGYSLPNLTEDPLFEMLTRRKRPEQIWFGLEPGWVINLHDKTILQPKTVEAKEYYSAQHVYGGTLEEINVAHKNLHLEITPKQKVKAAK